MQDVAKLFLLAGLVQLIMFFMVMSSFVRSHASARSILLQLHAALIDSAVPGLAAVLVFVRIATLLRLRRQGLLVSDTHRMFTAGHLDVVLFDKTGTLTSEQVGWLFLALLLLKLVSRVVHASTQDVVLVDYGAILHMGLAHLDTVLYPGIQCCVLTYNDHDNCLCLHMLTVHVVCRGSCMASSPVSMASLQV